MSRHNAQMLLQLPSRPLRRCCLTVRRKKRGGKLTPIIPGLLYRLAVSAAAGRHIEFVADFEVVP